MKLDAGYIVTKIVIYSLSLIEIRIRIDVKKDSKWNYKENPSPHEAFS